MSVSSDDDPFPHRHPAGYEERANAPAYGECLKAACKRLVSPGSAYCCAPCAEAAAGRYEIDAHSPGCDERAAQRSG